MPNVTLAAGTNTNEVVGDAAHDAAVAGNPLLLGFEAKDQDGSALPNAVAAEGRVVRGAASLSGVQYVMPVNEDGSAVATINAAQSGSWNVGTVTTVTAVTAISNALPAGTNAIGKLAANSGVDIGDVDVTSLPASTNTLEVVGDVAHNVAAAGNPVLIAASVETIADSAPDNRVTTDARASRLSVTDGALFVIPAGPQQWSYHSDGSSALTDATVHSAPGSGLSLYVTSIVFSTGAATACNIFFEEGSTKVLGPWYLEAVAGRGLAVHFGTPKKITANTALTVTTSAAIAQAVDVTGFIAPG
jgi:hypothetical protein